MPSDPQTPDDALYDKASDIADKHLRAALAEGGETEYLVAVMMIESAVNSAVELTSGPDIVRLLRDLAEQIESDEDDDD